MRVVGIIEMIVGLAILTRWTRLGAYVAMVWLVAIAINLATTGMFFDLAVRDIEIAIGAYALARLTEVRESTAVSAGSTGGPKQRTRQALRAEAKCIHRTNGKGESR